MLNGEVAPEALGDRRLKPVRLVWFGRKFDRLFESMDWLVVMFVSKLPLVYRRSFIFALHCIFVLLEAAVVVVTAM